MRRSPLQEPQFTGPGDRPTARRDPELAVDRDGVCLNGVGRDKQFGAQVGERQMSRQQRQQAQLGGGQGRRPAPVAATLLAQLGPQRLSLADQGAQTGPPLEQLLDFPQQCAGPGRVAERQVHAGELDPGLNGDGRFRVGQELS